MKTSVALIGFMGAGKSAASKALAERLGKKLVDVDSLIMHKAGKSIPQIFREDGEIAFRELEIEVIKEISSGKNQVIDCGGGVVLNKINIDRLKQNSVIVWLIASPEVIVRRTIMDGDGRPLLQGKDTSAKIKDLLQKRQPFYEISSDIKIDTSELNISSMVEIIIDKLKENADYSP
jgi:shikimate kinase